MGPCVLDAKSLPDPQSLKLELKLNGDTKQSSSTAQMIFPIAALIEFISSMVTLEPGDIISTGTPSGVGHTSGTFLKDGDIMHGCIEKIGTLVTKVAKELDCPYESEIVFSRRDD
jgi:2-keto-4-pentenoate hydratase/2-oxohepta-3-ene-1,7-dioic acid hydratase in catechol pathway